MSTTQDIVAKLWNLCNVLRDDGVTYHQYVTELTFLLFLKMAEETGTEERLPAGYRWRDLVEQSAPDRLEDYKKLLIHLVTSIIQYAKWTIMKICLSAVVKKSLIYF